MGLWSIKDSNCARVFESEPNTRGTIGTNSRWWNVAVKSANGSRCIDRTGRESRLTSPANRGRSMFGNEPRRVNSEPAASPGRRRNESPIRSWPWVPVVEAVNWGRAECRSKCDGGRAWNVGPEEVGGEDRRDSRREELDNLLRLIRDCPLTRLETLTEGWSSLEYPPSLGVIEWLPRLNERDRALTGEWSTSFSSAGRTDAGDSSSSLGVLHDLLDDDRPWESEEAGVWDACLDNRLEIDGTGAGRSSWEMRELEGNGCGCDTGALVKTCRDNDENDGGDNDDGDDEELEGWAYDCGTSGVLQRRSSAVRDCAVERGRISGSVGVNGSRCARGISVSAACSEASAVRPGDSGTRIFSPGQPAEKVWSSVDVCSDSNPPWIESEIVSK